MKYLLMFLLLIPVISRSQSQDSSFAQINDKFNKASTEMIKFHSQFQMGVMMQLVGGMVVIAGSAGNGNTEAVAIAGGLISLIGFIINVSSSSHIKKAGLILRGNSLVVPIYKKKPGRLF